jgi:ribosomal protein S18 acetylase RimI-like enzyme
MIRPAHDGEFLAVVRLLEGALLEVDPDRIREAIDRDDVLVASEEGRVRGALVLDGSHVEAVAVGRRHRGRGIGSALVRAAAAREEPITAAFEPRARGFYESLGFEIGSRGDRLYGRFDGDKES